MKNQIAYVKEVLAAHSRVSTTVKQGEINSHVIEVGENYFDAAKNKENEYT
jgi:hypothetical protein